MKNIFCSLGGGDEIGASCYFVCIGGYNFIFDAGIRYTEKRRYPSLSSVDKIDSMDTLNDLDVIFLSHSHSDHNGALPLLVSRLIKGKEIICSEKTKYSTINQLDIVKNNPGVGEYSTYESINIERCQEMLSGYPIDKKIDKKGYSFTLYHAGHIPGATMTLLECLNTKILYTGDFSNIDYPMTSKYSLPKVKDLDLLIINSTKLYKSSSKDSLNYTYKELNRILFETFNGENNIIEIPKLNSGLEMAVFLGKIIKEGAWINKGIKVYVDSIIWEFLQTQKELVETDFFDWIFKVDENINHKEKNIIIALNGKVKFKNYKTNSILYSLHADFNGIKELIKKLKPKKTFVVHYDKESLKMSFLKELKNDTELTLIENENRYNF
ncbi:MAG: MBL fold metallo-hydrolase [Cetobacterium sp.]